MAIPHGTNDKQERIDAIMAISAIIILGIIVTICYFVGILEIK